MDKPPVFRYPLARPLIGPVERRYVQECMDSGWISSSGSFVTRFEERFAARFGPGRAAAVANGTVAIELALSALGVGPGHEVIVPDLTFVGSAAPVLRLGARPVFAPCGPAGWNAEAAAMERLFTPRTKAVVAVHLYGVPCDIAPLARLCAERGVRLVEDCAEALGASVAGRSVGTFGDVACYSFYGNKVLTTGEGGMCLARDEALLGRIRVLRDHGRRPGPDHYWHEEVGTNARMTSLQAAVGLGQVERFDEMAARRRAVHLAYEEVFHGAPEFHPVPEPRGMDVSVWLESRVLARGRDRGALLAVLQDRGIETRPFFHPVQAMPPYRAFGAVAEWTEFYARHGFNLPTYEAMTPEDARAIGRTVLECLRA